MISLQQFIDKHGSPPPSINRSIGNDDLMREFVRRTGWQGYRSQWANDVIEYYKAPDAFHNLCVHFHGEPRKIMSASHITAIKTPTPIDSLDIDSLSSNQLKKLKKKLEKVEYKRAEQELEKVPNQVLESLILNYESICCTGYSRKITLAIDCNIFIAMEEDVVRLDWEFPEVVLEDQVNEFYIFKQFPEFKDKFKQAKKDWAHYKEYIQNTAKTYDVSPDALWKKIIKEKIRKEEPCGV